MKILDASATSQLSKEVFMKQLSAARLGGAAAIFAVSMSVFTPGMADAQTTPAAGTAIGAAADVSNSAIKQLIAYVQANNNTQFTIHKYLGDPVTPQPGQYTGTTEDAPATKGLTPAKGVQFSVQKVNNIDLTTVAGWQAYANLGTTIPSPDNLGPATTLTTGTNGQASGNFEVGVYYVTETVTPRGASPIAPFYVALPLPDSRSDAADSANGTVSWNQDVHVYPKNQPVTAKKSVSDKNVVAGENVRYTVTGSIPAVPQNGAFDGYTLVDDYDETRVTPNIGSIAVRVGDTALESQDFVTREGAEANAGKFAVSLTRSGLDKLAEARLADPQAKVTLTFDAKVIADAAAGEAVNNANVLPPNTSAAQGVTREPFTPGDNPPPNVPNVPANQVKTVLGQITINKTDSETNDALADAEFQLYRCQPGQTTTIDGPITINGKNSWTTDREGRVTLPAIQVEDFYNNASQKDEFDFCLVESRAPKGYALNPTPLLASVTSAQTQVTVDVTNVPDKGMFRLPSTGLAGTTGLIVIGGALATAAATRQARKNRAA